MASPYHYDYEAKEKEYKPPKLQTNRKMWKLMLFDILTFGIYNIVFFIPFSFDLDKAAPKKDHTKTMNYILAFILPLFTFSFVLLIWHHHIASRIEEALAERDIDYSFGTGTFSAH